MSMDKSGLKLCTITHERNRGWILERIAREVEGQFQEATHALFPGNLPPASHYFVTHYSMLPEVMEQISPLSTPITCFFTHKKPGLEKFVKMLNLCHAVICESREGMELLEGIGVHPLLLHFIPEGGDNILFRPHERGNGKVLISGSYYERKNPELLFQVISKSQREFILLGKGWEHWDGYKELMALPNLRYHGDKDYKDYPALYSQCDVYLSCSTLEGGGPNSLIEAMHANLFPVVSDTGNAREYIIHGYNGYIFPQGTDVQTILAMIELAYKKKPREVPPYQDIWETVRPFTWDAFSKQVREVITGEIIPIPEEENTLGPGLTDDLP